MRTLHDVAKAINDDPSLGITATVQKSWASTDGKVAGTRFRRQGKGRTGLKLVVTSVRLKRPVCEVDTAQFYENARDAIEWLEKWRRFVRHFHRVPTMGEGHVVPGEPKVSRGRVLTAKQLRALPSGSFVWVRVKEHGEDFYRMNDALPLTKTDCNEGRILTIGQEMPINYAFPGIDFDSTDADMPTGDERLSWDDGENEISLAAVSFSH